MHNEPDTLQSKVALITGGARRIGAEIARCLHKEGMNIALHYRTSLDDARRLRDELNATRPESVQLFEADLVHHVGLSPDFVNGASHYDAGSAHVQLVMAGEPMYTQHLKLDVPLTEDERRESLRAMAIIPVRHEDRVIACLNVASHELDEVPLNSREAREASTMLARARGLDRRVQREQIRL